MQETETTNIKMKTSCENIRRTQNLDSHDSMKCDCCAHDDDEKNALKKIIAASILFAFALLFEHLPIFSQNGFFVQSLGANFNIVKGAFVLLYLAAYLIVGKSTVLGAVKNIRSGKIFGEQFLMSVASIAAVFLGEYAEAVAVMLFYQIGEFFQDYAVDKSRDSISALIDLRPDSANVLRNGTVQKTNPQNVQVGEIIEVRSGERIALDGVVVAGESFADTSALTGESTPRRIKVGSDILAGFVNGQGVVRVLVKKAYSQSAVSRILELTQKAGESKAKSENLVERFAKIYTPIVCVLALAVAVIPSVLFGSFSVWIHRAIMFLVVSCPCALVISVPLSFFCGIGAASKRGILVKGSNFVEHLANLKTIAFDKTGTLTKGVFEVSKIVPNGMTEDELLILAAKIEQNSNHPIAKSILDFAQKRGVNLMEENCEISEIFESGGRGICAKIGGKKACAGNARFMEEQHISGFFSESQKEIGAAVYIAFDGKYAGKIAISDALKPNIAQSLDSLKKLGVKNLVMLTGDTKENAQAVADSIGISQFRANLLPEDKVRAVEEFLSAKNSTGFVGDGVNDSPVLARADVGIAMGALGSDAAIEAADVVLMNDDIQKIAEGIKISRKILRIVIENIALSIGVKATVIVLSALGITGLWLAVFSDVGVCFLAILNAARAMRIK